ncbi:unnamed protein product [Urochloa humidicola]
MEGRLLPSQRRRGGGGLGTAPSLVDGWRPGALLDTAVPPSPQRCRPFLLSAAAGSRSGPSPPSGCGGRRWRDPGDGGLPLSLSLSLSLSSPSFPQVVAAAVAWCWQQVPTQAAATGGGGVAPPRAAVAQLNLERQLVGACAAGHRRRGLAPFPPSPGGGGGGGGGRRRGGRRRCGGCPCFFICFGKIFAVCEP